MNYTKPMIIAQNAPQGNYAAGCPVKLDGGYSMCRECDRAS